jgi:heat shock protein HslJ
MQISVSAGLQGTAWILANTTGGVSININFGSATLTGFAGCNTYNATYTLGASGVITISPITSTQAVCSEEIMAQENQYLQTLQLVNGYVITGNQLTLSGSAGTLLYSALIATPY